MVILEENIEFETDFDKEKIANEVVEFILKKENCPWDVEVDILITESEEVQDYNREYRDIDKTTDVLSFPNIDWEAPADYSNVDEKEFNASSFNPETNLTILGDICLNRDRIISQAEEYGHSVKREYAFLIAHSMLHLLGYDHMEEAEAKVMEDKQKEYLAELGINR
ncbi:MAG: rRNA maturation RNase YbeY [Lachnospiraceae bacterium]|nr:rRNA maturation RNase YbeY [Lachnospiraceae bacterium]